MESGSNLQCLTAPPSVCLYSICADTDGDRGVDCSAAPLPPFLACPPFSSHHAPCTCLGGGRGASWRRPSARVGVGPEPHETCTCRGGSAEVWGSPAGRRDDSLDERKNTMAPQGRCKLIHSSSTLHPTPHFILPSHPTHPSFACLRPYLAFPAPLDQHLESDLELRFKVQRVR